MVRGKASDTEDGVKNSQFNNKMLKVDNLEY